MSTQWILNCKTVFLLFFQLMETNPNTSIQRITRRSIVLKNNLNDIIITIAYISFKRSQKYSYEQNIRSDSKILIRKRKKYKNEKKCIPMQLLNYLLNCLTI